MLPNVKNIQQLEIFRLQINFDLVSPIFIAHLSVGAGTLPVSAFFAVGPSGLQRRYVRRNHVSVLLRHVVHTHQVLISDTGDTFLMTST